MNIILHDFPTANILSGNTLTSPKFKDGDYATSSLTDRLRTYDYVVANPGYSPIVPFEEIADEQDN